MQGKRPCHRQMQGCTQNRPSASEKTGKKWLKQLNNSRAVGTNIFAGMLIVLIGIPAFFSPLP
jgi:hypothetical protein